MTISIVGTWVTSFASWERSNPADLPYLFQILNNRFLHSIWEADYQDRFDAYFPPDPVANPPPDGAEEEYGFLSVINPVPFATLSCFKFTSDLKLKCWARWNNMEGLSDEEFDGDYDLQWRSDYGIAGGTITLRNLVTHEVHTTLKYLMMDPNEIRFIDAYTTATETPTGIEYVPAPSGAGVMRKVKLPHP